MLLEPAMVAPSRSKALSQIQVERMPLKDFSGVFNLLGKF